MEEQSCCAPASTSTSTRETAEAPQRSTRQPRGQVRIPGGQRSRWATRSARGTPATASRRSTRCDLDGVPRSTPPPSPTRSSRRFVKATGHLTDAEEFGLSAVFHLAGSDADRRARHRSAARPARRGGWPSAAPTGAHPAGPGSTRRRPAEPPGRARLWHDAQAYCRLGRQAAADRGRVGVRRPRRPRRARATPGATSSPRRAAGSATSGRATFPDGQHRWTTAT